MKGDTAALGYRDSKHEGDAELAFLSRDRYLWAIGVDRPRHVQLIA